MAVEPAPVWELDLESLYLDLVAERIMNRAEADVKRPGLMMAGAYKRYRAISVGTSHPWPVITMIGCPKKTGQLRAISFISPDGCKL